MNCFYALTFSANSQLIAAMNPYPCGNFGDPQRPVGVRLLSLPNTRNESRGHCLIESTFTSKCQESIRKRVQAARNIQKQRFASLQSDIICNVDMRVGEIRQFCKLQEEGQSLMRAAMTQLNLSASASHHILNSECTIADLAGYEEIQSAHLAERCNVITKIVTG